MGIRRTFGLGFIKLAPLFAVTAAFGAGCGGEGPDADLDSTVLVMPEEKVLAEEALYMRQVFEQKSADTGLGFMRVDLGDEKQYQFLVHRLLKSGHTLENSPRVFESVKRARAAHLAKPPVQPVLGNEPVAASSQALDGDPCIQLLTSPQIGNIANSHVDAMTTLNCFGGSSFPYGYTDVATYETDANETYLTPLDYNAVESYTGVGNISTADIQSWLAANVGKYHYVDGISYTEDGNGNSYSTYVFFKGPATGTAAGITVAHPANFRGGTTIRSCIKRGAYVGNGDCDYAAVDANGAPSQNAVGVAKMVYVNGNWQADTDPANKWYPITGFQQMSHLYLPTAGTFDLGTDSAGANCTISSFKSARAVMSLDSPNGGWCVTGNSGANSTDMYTNIQSKTGARTANYNVLSDFGTDCLSLVSGTANTVPVKVLLSVAAVPTSTVCGAVRTSSLPITGLDFKDSCFAKGTGILRADGKYVAVEDIQMGDKVIANDHGLTLSVVSMTRGGENHPMYRILDDKGHNVLLTELHPVVTSDGILPAHEVREGLGVETDMGPATVVAVEEVRYDDAVYNLALGTPEQLAKVSADDRTMFAGGIRVGDNEMQLDLTKKTHPTIRGQVAAAWRKDFENAAARGANIYITP